MRIAGILTLLALVAIVLFAVRSAHLVTTRMAGARWAIPSRLYAAPILIFPGAPLTRADLRTHLRALGYVSVKKSAPSVGQWSEAGDRWIIGRRAYRDAVGKHGPRTLDLVWEGDRIHQMHLIGSDSTDEIYTDSMDPQMIAEFFPANREERTLVRLDEVPVPMRESILLMEDRNFYKHHGISLRGLARAMWANVQGAKVTQGGSTLTQQLMKNFFLTPERTLRRKFKEAIMTIVAEVLYSKDEIFEAYLNEIYLGQRGATAIHGFGEAAKFYVSKPVSELTLGEQAMLVGLIASPGQFSPYRDPEATVRRRRVVLDQLIEAGKISEPEFQNALREPVEPRGRTEETRIAPYFSDYLVNELSQRFNLAALQSEGYGIFSTLDPILQQFASEAIAKGLVPLDRKLAKKAAANQAPLEVALIAVQPQTGAIRAMIGGRNYSQTQFNRVTDGKRQPGSAVKPFVAAVALTPKAEGEPPVATVATRLRDQPDTYSFSGRDWKPTNYENKYFGEVTLRTAIERSLNAATINLAAQVGLDRLSEKLLAWGFPAAPALPSLVLGSIEITPLQLAQAYTIFANGGLQSTPNGVLSVISPDGQPVEQQSMLVSRALPPEVAYLVTSLLVGVVERGTAQSAAQIGPEGAFAGKTGTTDDYRDSWFVGYTPSLLTVVWLGYDDNRSTTLSGAAGALPIWAEFMRKASRRIEIEPFSSPKDIEWFEVERDRGCEGGHGESLREPFLSGTRPLKCD